jgi:sulfur relay protein TusB/DsrH
MRTLIVLKDKDPEPLGTAEILQEKGEDVAIVLMLDAVYMATGIEKDTPVKGMMENGADFILLKRDVERRGLSTRLLPGVELVDYERLMDILFSEDQRVLNL